MLKYLTPVLLLVAVIAAVASAAPIAITQCMAPDASPLAVGEYVLANDLSAVNLTTRACLRFKSGELTSTLDGQGYTVKCATACNCVTGISFSGVLITNVIIEGFQTGLVISDTLRASKITVRNVVNCIFNGNSRNDGWLYGMQVQLSYNVPATVIDEALIENLKMADNFVYGIYGQSRRIRVVNSIIRNLAGRVSAFRLESESPIIQNNQVYNLRGIVKSDCLSTTNDNMWNLGGAVIGVQVANGGTNHSVFGNTFSDFKGSTGSSCNGNVSPSLAIKGGAVYGVWQDGADQRASMSTVVGNTFSSFEGGESGKFPGATYTPTGGDVYGVFTGTKITAMTVKCNAFTDFLGGTGAPSNNATLSRKGVGGMAVGVSGYGMIVANNNITRLLGGYGGGNTYGALLYAGSTAENNQIHDLLGGFGNSQQNANIVGGKTWGIALDSTAGGYIAYNNIYNISGGFGGNVTASDYPGAGGASTGIELLKVNGIVRRNTITNVVGGVQGTNSAEPARTAAAGAAVTVKLTSNTSCNSKLANPVTVCYTNNATYPCCDNTCSDTCTTETAPTTDCTIPAPPVAPSGGGAGGGTQAPGGGGSTQAPGGSTLAPGATTSVVGTTNNALTACHVPFMSLVVLFVSYLLW